MIEKGDTVTMPCKCSDENCKCKEDKDNLKNFNVLGLGYVRLKRCNAKEQHYELIFRNYTSSNKYVARDFITGAKTPSFERLRDLLSYCNKHDIALY